MGKKDDKPPLRVVLRILFHCPQCERRVRKAALSIDGVQRADVDTRQDKLTIYGFVEPEKLVKKLGWKTGKRVDILQVTEENSKHDKEERRVSFKESGSSERRVSFNESGSSERRVSFNESGSSLRKEDRLNKDEYNYGTRIIFADKMNVFSDENPSGCSVM